MWGDVKMQFNFKYFFAYMILTFVLLTSTVVSLYLFVLACSTLSADLPFGILLAFGTIVTSSITSSLWSYRGDFLVWLEYKFKK